MTAGLVLTAVLTWQLLHAVGGAEVVLQGAVRIHGHVEVELRSEGEQSPGVVSVFDGPDTDTQQPVHVQHLVLEQTQVRKHEEDEEDGAERGGVTLE